jgi:hypothetical protein
MRKIHALLLLALLLASVSCKKNYPKVKGDYFIVGWSGTFAGISKYFIVTDSQLLQDTTKGPIPEAVGDFQFDYPLPQAKFDKVRQLPYEIPAEMLSQNNKAFGKITMSDGVAIEVRSMKDGVQYRWYFNDDLNECSAAVQQFGSKLYFFVGL